jgi:hypothetical protein
LNAPKNKDGFVPGQEVKFEDLAANLRKKPEPTAEK